MSTRNPSEETAASCPQLLCSSGAAAFYERHAQPTFLEACYSTAPARIQAALREEVECLRGLLRDAGRVLELGCGNGRLLEAFRDTGARGWVGVDFLPPYLREARRRRLAPGTGLAAGNAAQLPFAEASFDDVLCAQSTLGLMGEQKLAALREAARVTRPGGRLIFVVYSELSVVPRAEWYTEMHRQGMMAALDWARSGPELLVTEDGHASECFRRERLEGLFRETGLAPQVERLGELYWLAQARRPARPADATGLNS